MDDFVTIVSGMPRSGTSLVMQMLLAGGMPVLTDGVRAADAHNPMGYLEYEPVKRLPTDSSWVAGARGKAVKVIYRLLEYLPPSIDYRVLFVDRDLHEVFASQRDMLIARGDDAALQDETEMVSALADEVTSIERWMAAEARMRVMKVPHAGLIEDPREWASRISGFLDRELDLDAMAAVVNRGLYRHRA
jgi:hypothetical protein